VLRRGGGEVAARWRRVLGIRMRQGRIPRDLRQSQQIHALDRRNHRQALVKQSQDLGGIWNCHSETLVLGDSKQSCLLKYNHDFSW